MRKPLNPVCTNANQWIKKDNENFVIFFFFLHAHHEGDLHNLFGFKLLSGPKVDWKQSEPVFLLNGQQLQCVVNFYMSFEI